MRKGYRGGEVLFAARVAGQQHADLTHADAVTRRPAGAGIIAGELPVFCARKTLQGSRQQGVEQRPSQQPRRTRAYQSRQQSVRGNYRRDVAVRISESGQGATHTALGEA